MWIRSDSFRVPSGRGASAGFICALSFILLFLVIPGTALASNVGYLDPSFGTGGIVTTSLGGSPMIFTFDAAMQTDGKILVAGGRYEVPPEDIFALGVARFLPDGSLDPAFGLAPEAGLHPDCRSDIQMRLWQFSLTDVY